MLLNNLPICNQQPKILKNWPITLYDRDTKINKIKAGIDQQNLYSGKQIPMQDKLDSQQLVNEHRFIFNVATEQGSCIICTMIVKDPQECVGCRTPYCYECIREVEIRGKSCPKKCQGD